MRKRAPTLLVGVDIGGTFTDCVVLDRGGGITATKSASTPANFAEGMLATMRMAAERLGLSFEQFCRGFQMLRALHRRRLRPAFECPRGAGDGGVQLARRCGGGGRERAIGGDPAMKAVEHIAARAVDSLRAKYGRWGGYDDWAAMNAKAVFFYLMMDA